MKELQSSFRDVPPTKNIPLNIVLNKENLLKYLILFVVVSGATLVIPTCGVLRSQAVMVGLLASTTFAVIDMVYPNYVYINEFHHHS
tara:strand:- start:1680 stop:1940 length:261 start_codon:yes stop_codon:yes gene_type:complete